MEYYGIRGVANDWFVSYLSNRKQLIALLGTNSDYQTVTCGVPQGSVLSPLLFLLYINNMPKCSNLNVEVEKVSQWLYANKLSLNIDKNSFVVFHSPQKRIAHKLNLSISNLSVKSDTQVKYLELIFDSNLNWVRRFQEVLEWYLKLDIM